MLNELLFTSLKDETKLLQKAKFHMIPYFD